MHMTSINIFKIENFNLIGYMISCHDINDDRLLLQLRLLRLQLKDDDDDFFNHDLYLQK